MKKTSFIKLLVVFFYFIVTNGCCFFNFRFYKIYEGTFNKNGSGVYSIELNCEQARDLLFYSTKFCDDIPLILKSYIDCINSAYEIVRKQYPQTTPTVKYDEEKGIITFKFKFGSIKELNTILAIIHGNEIIKYMYGQHKFVQYNKIIEFYDNKLKEMEKNDNTAIKWFSIRHMFQNVNIILRYNFDEKVIKINNDKLIVSKDKRQVNIKYNMYNLKREYEDYCIIKFVED